MVGPRPRLPRPTGWNTRSCIIETDGRDCDHNFPRLRIDHLDYLEYCSCFTRVASVSSYDAACSCSASFQRFTRLLDLRSVMRCSFLTSCKSNLSPAVGPLCPAVVALLPAVGPLFMPAVGHALFLPVVGCALRLWSASTIHLLSTDPRLHLVVHREPQNLLRSMQQEVTLEVHRFLLLLLVDGHKSALTSFSVLPRVTCCVGPATLHCQDSLYSEEPIRACISLTFNSSPGKLHDTDETVLSCT